METLRFLTPDQVRTIQRDYGTPVFVYDEATLKRQAAEVMAFPAPFGLRARYAMKACPTAGVLRVLWGAGLHIDASSGFEAQRAMHAGIPASHIQITAQQLPDNLSELLDLGVLFTACSIHQLRAYGRLRPGSEACVRINPGLGSGHSNRTNVGGVSSSFGIWHEHLDQVAEVCNEFNLRITRMHTHIGSGADPEVWNRCAQLSLGIVRRLPEVRTLSLGGGFKVGRMKGEVSTDLQVVGEVVAADLRAFADEDGRQLALEIEPGTFLAANAGALLTSVIDIVDTGADGHRFIKCDSGMTEVTRPSLYGAQHPLVIVPMDDSPRATGRYLVAGHCCESGDVLTPEPDNPEGLLPRELTEAQIGDALVVGGAGAYCSAMSTKNYNSFPEAPEVLLRQSGVIEVIRNRQTLDQQLINEV